MSKLYFVTKSPAGKRRFDSPLLAGGLGGVGLFLVALFLISCSLDELIIGPQETEEYNFRTDVIRAQNREIVTFNSEGNTLYGVYAFHRQPPDALPRMTMLYCHGREENLNRYWYEIEQIYISGFDVFGFDYRGFGRSEGRATLEGLYADGRAALDYVLNQIHINPDSLSFFGNSLGSGVAAYLAADVLAPRRLILEAPYSSAQEWASAVFPLNLPASFVIDGDFNNMPFIERLSSPLFVLHGGDDDVLPFEHHGRIVYEAAAVSKQLLLATEARHDNIVFTVGTNYFASLIQEFVFTEPPADSMIVYPR